jgi:hypothetical protein
MAEIVQSLFGVSPEMYQQNQQAMADRQALQFAQLTPFQQANFAIGRGANMLGGAIGGALGGQDPELQRITARQQIARQIDLTDPESIQSGMAMLQQAGDTVGLQQLAQIFRQQQESGALIAQRTAAAAASTAAAGRERAPPTTNEITNARALALRAGAEGSPAYNAAFNTELEKLTAPKEARGPSFGAEAERVAAELFDNKTFADLTPTQKAVVNRRVDAESTARARATAPSFSMPGQKALVDIPAFRAKVQSTIDPQAKAVFAADNALTAIEDSINTNNFVSFNAARVQLAKALGDSQLSRRDVEQAGGDPSLLGGLADTASKLFTGTPTLDTQNKIKKTLQAIKTVATNKANAEIDRQRKIALRSPGYDAAAVNAALDFPEFSAAPAAAAVAPQTATNPKTGQRIMSTDGGKTWTPVR